MALDTTSGNLTSSSTLKVYVGNQGLFESYGRSHTSPEEIDAIFEKLNQVNPVNVCLYFHGGLVSELDGNKVADRLDKEINGNITKIFFVWKTGFAETVKEGIENVADLKLFNKVRGFVLSKFVRTNEQNTKGLSKVNFDTKELLKENPFDGPNLTSSKSSGGIKGVGLIFESDQQLEEEARSAVENDPEFEKALIELEREAVVKRKKGAAITFIVKAMVSITRRVYSRLTQSTDHGLYPTIMEELFREFYISEVGGWVWSKMKEKAEGMWGANTDDRKFLGNYFVTKLSQFLRDRNNCKLHLIGHSAGAIAICHLIKSLAARQIKIRISKVIFLAPACTNQLFTDAILAHQNAIEIESLSLFMLEDENEQADKIVPFLYPRSLLYFVSGVLEISSSTGDTPLLGMKRFFTKQASPMIVDYFLTKKANQIIIAGSSGVLSSNSKTHGGFDDDPATIDSINKILYEQT